MILIRADTKPNTKWIFLKILVVRAVIIILFSVSWLNLIIRKKKKISSKRAKIRKNDKRESFSKFFCNNFDTFR